MSSPNVCIPSKRLDFNTRGRMKVKNDYSFVDRGSGYCQLVCSLHFNLQEIAVEILKVRYKQKYRTLSKSTFAHENNFIPCGIRQEMKNTSYSISALRNQSLLVLWERIEEKIKFILKSVSEITGYCYERSEIDVFIKKVEINYDLPLEVSEVMILNPSIRHSLNRVFTTAEGVYDENGKFQACNFDSLSFVKSLMEQPAIKIWGESGGANWEGLIYIKEDGIFGCLNRVEFRFNKELLTKVIGRRKVYNLKHLKEMIFDLSEKVFILLINSLDIEIKKNKKSYKKLKKVLKRVFEKHWDDIYLIIKKQDYIFTKKKSSKIPKSSINRIPKLAKNKIIFKKIKGAKYSIDWNNLSNASANYAKFKSEEKQKQIEKNEASSTLSNAKAFK